MPWLLAILGPTASGKTELAESIADQTGAQLVNADAFQVYRHLNVGTGKSSRAAEYQLLDLVEPETPFGLGEWLRQLEPALQHSFELGQSVILVGGTGYYVRAALEGFDALHPAPAPELRARLAQTPLETLVTELRQRDPATASQIDLKNPVRVTRALEKLESVPLPVPALPPFSVHKWAIDPPDMEHRIKDRTRAMLDAGWREEVRALRDRGLSPEAPGLRAIGYRILWNELENNRSPDESRDEIIRLTRQYAKRQRTWLRKERNLVRIAMSERDEMIAKLTRSGDGKVN